MTLARTALRIAAIEALIYGSLAGDRVFDSRWDDMAPEQYPDEGLPCVIVMTDGENADALSDQNGGPPFRRMIELVLEISMTQVIPVDGEIDPGTGEPYPSGAFRLEFPATDRQTEASLDFMEWQLTRRLSTGDDLAARTFRSFTRIIKKETHRQINNETGVKVAARVVTYTIDTDDDEDQVFLNTPTGFDALPEPLRSVAMSLPPSSPRYQLCQAMASYISPDVGELMQGVDVDIDANRAENGASDHVKSSIDTLTP